VRVDIDVFTGRQEAGIDGGGTATTEKISDARFAIISKTTPYTHLGRLPLHVNRNAGLGTRLSITAFTQLRALSLIGGAASSIRSGKFLHHRKDVVQLDDIAALRVRSETPFPYQVDGDDAGDTNELHIVLETDALTVALPPPAPRREHS
jgi:diacylglycerol kinase family enzyme